MDTEYWSCEGGRDAAAAGHQNIAQEDSWQHRAVCDTEPLAAEHPYSLSLCWALVYPRSSRQVGFPWEHSGAELRQSETGAVGQWELRVSKCVARTCETQHI